MQRPFSAIFFDLDGTLIDSASCIIKSMELACTDLALPCPTSRRIRACMGIPLEVCVPEVMRELGSTLDAARVQAFITRYRSHYLSLAPEMVSLYPGILDLLESCHLRAIPLAVVTSKKSGPAQQNLDQLGIARYFAALVGSDSVTKYKPDPEPAFVAARALDIPRAELPATLVVGDAKVDIDMGRAAGCVTFAALWGAHDPASIAHAHASAPSAHGLNAWLATYNSEPSTFTPPGRAS